MKRDQAAENLQVIRTLMERSALYRRALAPIMTLCGLAGMIGGLLGWKCDIQSTQLFVAFWYAVAGIALVGSFVLARRQAFKAGEPFWSPPTKRVAQAMSLPLLIGFIVGVVFALGINSKDAPARIVIVMVWSWLYSVALHSGGFSISQGFRIFGWIIGLLGCAMLVWLLISPRCEIDTHLLMGALFGCLHLAYGIYLYFTESRKTAP